MLHSTLLLGPYLNRAWNRTRPPGLGLRVSRRGLILHQCTQLTSCTLCMPVNCRCTQDVHTLKIWHHDKPSENKATRRGQPGALDGICEFYFICFSTSLNGNRFPRLSANRFLLSKKRSLAPLNYWAINWDFLDWMIKWSKTAPGYL